MKTRVVVVGESHGDLYTQAVGGATNRVYLRATTMHRVGRDGVAAVLADHGHAACPVAPGEWLVFVVGEVDCRCHVHVQVAEQGRTEAEVLGSLAGAYVRELAVYAAGTGARVVACGVVPPLEHGDHHDEAFPIRGAFRTRLRYQRELNRLVEAGCDEAGLVFVGSPSWAADAGGGMRMELSDGIIHIANTPENVARAGAELFEKLSVS